MAAEYQHTLPVGIDVEQYEIKDVLGAGGFGITYKGWDNRLHRDVAVKEFLPVELAVRGKDDISVQPRDAKTRKEYTFGLKKFLEEARMLARFKEPNIVRVTNFLEANGTAYLVMDYEEGESLAQYLGRHHILSEDQLNAIFIATLHGLRAVHDKSVLHRDIKPGNIYLRKDGTPMLIDFGAARQALGEQTRSMTGIVTVGYAPFEQYSARGKQGPWTDLYALGATMYRCTTGVSPPEAPERIAAIQEAEPDPLVPAAKAAKGQYDASLLSTIDWLLKPNRQDRPQKVDEVIDRLGEPPTQRPDEPPTQRPDELPTQRLDGLPTQRLAPEGPAPAPVSQPTPTRKRIAVKLAAVSAVLLLGGLGAFLWQASDQDRQTATEQVHVQRQQTIAVLLEQADAEFNSLQFTAPDGDNALEKYQKVLELDVNNVRAKQGLRRLVDRYVALAKAAIAEGQWANAVDWYHKAVAQGDAQAQNNLGAMYYNGWGVPKDSRKAVEWYRKAAAQGYVSAQNNLGLAYELGDGVPKDDKKAVEWYLEATAQGDISAQTNLGAMYATGRGVPKDFNKALEWYRKAAERGDPRAQTNLGAMYATGRGVPKDFNKAVEWYRKGALQGHARAQNNLGAMYYNGWGVPKDSRKAAEWYRKAAAQGDASAQNSLGIFYELGDGVPKDYGEAINWYRKAAAQGDPRAQTNLGVKYEHGWGVRKDFEKALEWYRKAAAQRHPWAQFKLGEMYEHSRGVPKNFNKAAEWYRKAASQGDADAKTALARLGVE
jgi:TPR repeat protein/serine/threonine protein kinase